MVKSLKIPKGKSKAEKGRSTDNTMTNRKRTKRQAKISTTLYKN